MIREGFATLELDSSNAVNRLDVGYYLVQQHAEEAVGGLPGDRLHNLCERVKTKSPPSEAYVNEGIPCIKLRNVRGSLLDLSDCDRIPAHLKSQYRLAERCDLVVTATGEGTAGRVDIFMEEDEYIVTGESILLRPNRDAINPFYLLAMLRASPIKAQLTHYVRGATGQTHLYWSDILDVWIPKADVAIQKKCEEVFTNALEARRKSDDLLAGLNRIAEDLLP